MMDSDELISSHCSCYYRHRHCHCHCRLSQGEGDCDCDGNVSICGDITWRTLDRTKKTTELKGDHDDHDRKSPFFFSFFFRVFYC